ncbi:hypothetical protein GUJ93_ZPchr0004g38919 [Zizania palustris]|uniref:Uncharacterized protein n=1 Tax=Zizania palustris TaxID=103762 RepID=A0A8J5T3I3_ZIZPA|nr:hypothetical protein GUJ93_ZPchr0004g38919 [Zizania palustris]
MANGRGDGVRGSRRFADIFSSARRFPRDPNVLRYPVSPSTSTHAAAGGYPFRAKIPRRGLMLPCGAGAAFSCSSGSGSN